MRIHRLKRLPDLVRTWKITEARRAHCPICERWLDDHDCTLRQAVLVHKSSTGHLPELYTLRWP